MAVVEDLSGDNAAAESPGETGSMAWLAASLRGGSTRSEAVLEALRSGLLDGRFQPGERLMEQNLSSALKVSRTPIRAALHMLAGEGLLDYEPNRGYLVRGFSLSEIIDAYDMRALAEGLAARRAAEHGLSDDAMRRAEEALAKGDRALRPGESEADARHIYAEVNAAFHDLILDAARSRLTVDVIRLCQRIPQAAAANLVEFSIATARERHAGHHRIYDAILAKEGHEAEAAMRAHVVSVKASMIRAFANVSRKRGHAGS